MVVSYQSQDEILPTLSALRRCREAGSLRCIVVDCASPDATAARVRAEHPWVELVEAGWNLGFGKACNLGSELASSPYVFILNADASIEPEDLGLLVAFLDDHPEVGVVAPSLETPQGEFHYTRPLPTPGEILRSACPGLLPRRSLLDANAAPLRVQWVPGAAFLVRAELLQQLGGFDPRFFLYFEETDLLHRVQSVAASEVWALGRARARHSVGASTARAEGTRVHGDLSEHFFASRLYYLSKHSGLITALATEAGELALLGVRAVLDLLRLRRPEKLAARLRGPLFRMPGPAVPVIEGLLEVRARAAPTEATAVVVIGRDEGARLELAIESARGQRLASGEPARVVYVDSGSQDASVERARSLGAEVVELDASRPFSAARARNEGLDRLLRDARPEFVQFVDGDCELSPDWIATAMKAMKEHPQAAIVCGSLSEKRAFDSLHGRICALEWDAPVGRVSACGGIFLARVEALRLVGGFDAGMFAGEEPELCLRLRALGFEIHRLAAPMAAHDAGTGNLATWWRRGVRGGRAMVLAFSRHGWGPERYKARAILSVLLWTLVLPLVALLLALRDPRLACFYPLLFGIQIARLASSPRARRHDRKTAWAWAAGVMCGKFAELVGIVTQALRSGLSSGPTSA